MKIKGWKLYRWGVASPSLYYVSAYAPLDREHRYWGREDEWDDGVHCFFGFWFFHVAWSLPWSKMKRSHDHQPDKEQVHEPSKRSPRPDQDQVR